CSRGGANPRFSAAGRRYPPCSSHLRAMDSIGTVYRAHFRDVRRTLMRMGVGDAVAEDLVQEVFVVAFRRWATYDRQRPVRSWLIGIAQNVARAHRRRLARHPEDANGADEPIDEGQHADDVRSAKVLARAMAHLSPE